MTATAPQLRRFRVRLRYGLRHSDGCEPLGTATATWNGKQVRLKFELTAEGAEAMTMPLAAALPEIVRQRVRDFVSGSGGSAATVWDEESGIETEIEELT